MGSVSLMQCPCCGKLFPTFLSEIADNGNVVCKVCSDAEHNKEE